MKTHACLVTLVVLAYVPYSLTAGAGRAFPIAGENYAIETFQRINRNIEWDPTNFLVDLSGNWANCQRVGHSGQERVDQQTPDGGSIAAIVDYTSGGRTDVEAANGYIREVIDRWIRSGSYSEQIRRADRFGCSIRPGCDGRAVIGCLFSPGYYGGGGGGGGNVENPPGEQNALAFTPEQYSMSETITGNRWDRSHFLENLSGFETQCSMMDAQEWAFANALQEGRNRGMRLTGLYGSARNYGSTDAALEEILRGFKTIGSAKAVGCSVIPDCKGGRGDLQDELYVVVSCLYEE